MQSRVVGRLTASGGLGRRASKSSFPQRLPSDRPILKGISKGRRAVTFGFLVGLLLVRPTLSHAAFADWFPQSGVAQEVAATTTNQQAPYPKLTLRVYNYARLALAPLDASERVAEAIFKQIGIETTWVECPEKKHSARASLACDSEMGTADLVLRILSPEMAGKLRSSADSLGFAQTCTSTEPACELSIFYDRVDQLSTNGYRADRILGYAIAHEVAHLLLGPGHSEEGIMRGQWTPSDLQRISWGLRMEFSESQSKRLRDAALRRTQPVPNETSTLAD